MLGRLLFPLLLLLTLATMESDLRARVTAQLQSLGLPVDDLSFLPVQDRETRDTDCPGVNEEVITYRLELQDGLQPDSILLSQVVKNDTSQQTYKANMAGKEWVEGSTVVRPYLNCLDWDNEELVAAVRKMIAPPSVLPYNFSVPVESLDKTSLEGEVGQPREVDQLVYGGKVKDGFFLEAGSFDSETNSDSLYWELEHGWEGLLVEPHPLAYSFGLTKQRKAHSVQTCLSIQPRPVTMDFDPHGSVRNSTSREAMAGLVREAVTEGEHRTFLMQCLPVYSLLLALGNPTVHYFSLDIEGAEFPVLQTIPWDLVDIRVLSVETHLAGRLFPGDRNTLIAYMEEVGYRHVSWAHQATNQLRKEMGTHDDLFVRKDVTLLMEEEDVIRQQEDVTQRPGEEREEL